MKNPEIKMMSDESIARKRALEFVMLSPTEKYEALIRLIKISYEIRQAPKSTALFK